MKNGYVNEIHFNFKSFFVIVTNQSQTFAPYKNFRHLRKLSAIKYCYVVPRIAAAAGAAIADGVGYFSGHVTACVSL